MNAPRLTAPPAALLEPEWERLLLLAYCLTRSRQGHKLADEDIAQVQRLDELVDTLRSPGGAWEQILGRLPSRTECDVLAAVVAPEFEPRLGWAYQHLQGGTGSTYPSRALLQELLALEAGRSPSLHEVLAPGHWPRRQQLVRPEREGAYEPVHPEAELIAR